MQGLKRWATKKCRILVLTKIFRGLNGVSAGQNVFCSLLALAPPGGGILKFRKQISKIYEQALLLRLCDVDLASKLWLPEAFKAVTCENLEWA